MEQTKKRRKEGVTTRNGPSEMEMEKRIDKEEGEELVQGTVEEQEKKTAVTNLVHLEMSKDGIDEKD